MSPVKRLQMMSQARSPRREQRSWPLVMETLTVSLKKDDIPKKELSVAADRVCNFCREKSIFLKICVVFFEPGTANLDEDWKGEIQI